MTSLFRRFFGLRRPDGLTRQTPLDQFAPATAGAPQIIGYRVGAGGQHAVLDLPYTSRTGTVHLVTPAGRAHAGMENFVENIAEQIRRTDPRAAALLISWPGGFHGTEPGHHWRIVFANIGPTPAVGDHTPEPSRADSLSTDEGESVEAYTFTYLASRYSDPMFLGVPAEHLTAVFGTDEFMSADDVDAYIAANPMLAQRMARIEQASAAGERRADAVLSEFIDTDQP